MTYLGNAVSQLDGSKFAHSNCVAAGTSELGDCSSLGFWKITPSRIRVLSNDTSGGISYGDAKAALSKATGGEVNLIVLYWAPQNSTTSTLDNILDAPRVTGVSISCAVTRYTPYRTGTYTGKHFVIVGKKRYATVTRADGSTYKQKQAYVMDPGRTAAKWVWWPWSLLVKATAASAGTGKIHVMYTRDLANVKRTTTLKAGIRSSPKVIDSPSNLVSTLAANTPVTVIETVKGGAWTSTDITPTHSGNGWSRIGTNKYVVGWKLR